MHRRDFLKLGLATAAGAGALAAGVQLATPRRGGPSPRHEWAEVVRSELEIPTDAWRRRIGQPLTLAGHVLADQRWQIDDGYWQGVPLGGMGSGSIGRSYRGDFARWHLDIGRHHYQTAWPNQFSVRVDDGRRTRAMVLCAARPPGGQLSAWRWDYPAGAGQYHALFPRAWFEYERDILGVDLTVKQLSPVLPHNYRESSYPVAVFEYAVHNPQSDPVTVSLMFTWSNLVPWGAGTRRLSDARATVETHTLAGGARGVTLGEGEQGQFCLAALEGHGVEVTCRERFQAAGDGADLWRDFESDGRLEPGAAATSSGQSGAEGVGLCARVTVQPGETRVVPVALSWDFPTMAFGVGASWYRRYTAFFGRSGGNAWPIAREALNNYRSWDSAIAAWQQPVLDDENLPGWYKTALFNELYYVVDAGTAWEAGEGTDPSDASEPGRFTYLECFDYPFYSTLDVRFYSSWALLELWPELEKQVLRQYAATVAQEDGTSVIIESSKVQATRKPRGAVPHDIGTPAEDPWRRPNAYKWQDVGVWKDLNSKFVLLAYRDYKLTHDHALLHDCWPAVKAAIDYLHAFDRDDDGLPENEGVPDQTYDTWSMAGPSAYCGGLWLAALAAARQMALEMDEPELADTYAEWQARGASSFEARLWNGRYYDYDTDSSHRDSIMADQLCGQWYASALQLEDIVPRDQALTALRTVFEFNVLGFADGTMGAVNGMRPDGSVDASSDQSQEVWSGVTYALAAFMLQMGLDEAAWRTAEGAYQVVYEQKGYWFRTPEAWTRTGDFRASMYMRPQSIWAIEHARRLRGGAET